MDLKELVAEYPDFPKKGILFRDFGPVLRDPTAVSQISKSIKKRFDLDSIDVLAGIESRGFLLAGIISAKHAKPMIMVRKAGKLPGKTRKTSYSIEYGRDTIEIQSNAIQKGERVLICDDLLATGGTAAAAAKLVKGVGGEVAGIAFIIELTALNGMKRLGGYHVESLIKY